MFQAFQCDRMNRYSAAAGCNTRRAGRATAAGQGPERQCAEAQPRRLRRLNPWPGRQPPGGATRHPRAQRHLLDRARRHHGSAAAAGPLRGGAHGGGAALLPHVAVQGLREDPAAQCAASGLSPDLHRCGRRGDDLQQLQLTWQGARARMHLHQIVQRPLRAQAPLAHQPSQAHQR